MLDVIRLKGCINEVASRLRISGVVAFQGENRPPARFDASTSKW